MLSTTLVLQQLEGWSRQECAAAKHVCLEAAGVHPAPKGYASVRNDKARSVAWRIRQAALIAQEATYRFDQFKSKKEELRRPLRKLTFAVERRNELAPAEEALQQGLAIAEGMALAKNLGNLPGNVCTPEHLAGAEFKAHFVQQSLHT